MSNIIFLDVDGVLNSQIYYETSEKFANYRDNVSAKEHTIDQYHDSQIDDNSIGILNEICDNTNSVIVVSSTWRNSWSSDKIKNLQELFDRNGGTFKVIGITGYSSERIRGVEIYKWWEANKNDYNNYVIIDDDSDMLLWQQAHFFQTDAYSGITPNITYRIIRFLNNVK